MGYLFRQAWCPGLEQAAQPPGLYLLKDKYKKKFSTTFLKTFSKLFKEIFSLTGHSCQTCPPCTSNFDCVE